MGTKLAGKSGDVYVADLLLSNCEVAWDSGTNGTASLNTTATYVKVGVGSAKIEIDLGIQVGDIIAYDAIASSNIAAYTHILCWAYSVPTTELNDYKIGIGTTGAGASPTTTVGLPILTATTWKYCHCTLTDGTFAATTGGTFIGVESNANGADGDILYLDDIRAAKVIAGINSWNLDYVTDALETSDFVSAGVRSYMAGPSGWSGSFSGYKDGAPLSIGSEYGLELAESATITQMWLGNAIITAVHPSTGFDGAVSYSYDFTGTGTLTVSSA